MLDCRRRAGNLFGKRLLIVEEALRSTAGHFFEYDRAVKEACEARGVEVVVCGHAAMEGVVKDSLGAVPAFPRTCWEIGFDRMGPLRRQCEIVRHNWMFFTTVRELVKRYGPFDVVFAPTVTIYHAPAIAALSLTVRVSKAVRFVPLFRNTICFPGPDGIGRIDRFKQRIWSLVFRMLSGAARKGRIFLATDSSRLAAEYRALAGVELNVLPHPAVTVRGITRERDFESGPFTFGHLGPPRREKGVDILLRSIRSFLDRRPDANVRFVIQWNEQLIGPDSRPVEPQDAFAGEPRVVFMRQRLDSRSYEEQLDGIDCMVLPYRRSEYGGRISGIAVEAASAGQVLIVTADTWLSDLADQYGHGLAVADGDPEALTAAMIAVYDDRSHAAAAARARSSQARRLHSTDSFVDLLWGVA